LVVDLDPQFVGKLAAALQERNFTAAGCANRISAYSFIREYKPKLIVSSSRIELHTQDIGTPYIRLVEPDSRFEPIHLKRMGRNCRGVFKRDLANVDELAKCCTKSLQGALCYAEEGDFCGMVGTSAGMQRVYEFVKLAGKAGSTVLLTGETGTGKDLVARAIHAMSGREGEFAAVNCAALPEALLESELFGHVKGAFTGACSENEGLIAFSERGTLFLDEVDSMPLSVQAKLLRFLQDGTIRKVGGSTQRTVNVQVIAAAQRSIKAVIDLRPVQFRPDLFYRLSVLTATLPPLRRRDGDVGRLAKHFLKIKSEKLKMPAPELAGAALQDHDWPGNVRELENVIERLVVTGRLEF